MNFYFLAFCASVVWIFSYHVEAQTSTEFVYDCRRPGSNCGDGNTCNLSSGNCICPNTTAVNYECKDLTGSGNCTQTCINGGCVSSACVCKQGYYGQTCEMPRVQVFCNAEEMFININPHPGFSGLITVFNKTDCQLQNNTGSISLSYVSETVSPKLQGLSLVIKMTDEKCGYADKIDGGFSRKFFIQYNSYFKSSVDQIITAECRLQNGSTTVYSGTNIISDIDSPYNQVNVSTEVEIVSLGVKNNDKGIDSNTPIKIGESIDLVFALKTGVGYTDIRVDNCKANNHWDKADNYKETEILKDGCPAPAAVGLFTGININMSSPMTVTISMKAFMFIGPSKQVNFVCNLTLCNSNSNCQHNNCSGFSNFYNLYIPPTTPAPPTTTVSPVVYQNTTTLNNTSTIAPVNSTAELNTTTESNTTTQASGRRRRAASDGEQKTAKATISVYDPSTTSVPTSEAPDSNISSECMQDPNILTVVIILSVMVVLLLVACSIFVWLWMRSVPKTYPADNTRYAANLETVRIPRLGVSQAADNHGC
ncbi:EGF-like domain-containing protein 2 [Physella acuta]|uniref:EGF-like domain-containing protein 2 n=1 Tax=Physella acuta TaxID=109671 RepID=UPI0027DDFA02|nr:EGF-like domain-containing protein 2 [Physella acuta]